MSNSARGNQADNAGAGVRGGHIQTAPANFTVGAVGFGPMADDDGWVQLTHAGWKRVTDGMAASIVRIQQELEEAQAQIAVYEAERMILLGERDEAREALRVLFKDYKELADSGDAGFWELEDQEAAQPALRILQQMEDTNSITKPEQVSSKLARYKKDAEVVTDEQEVFRRLVEAIVTTDMTANTLLEVRRLFGDEIDAAVACLRRTEK